MARVAALALLCAGCFDYEALSRGAADATAPPDLAAGDDLAVPDLEPPDALGDLANADLFKPPCPIVMIAFDNSGSTSYLISVGPDMGTVPEIVAEKASVGRLINRWSAQVPMGLEAYSGPNGMCNAVGVLVEPAPGNGAALQSALSAIPFGVNSNAAYAIQLIAADPNMRARPRSYILMITDGPPTCTPAATAVAAAEGVADGGIPTIVVGISDVENDVADVSALALAGGAPCTGSTCDGFPYYAAPTTVDIDIALTKIMLIITGGGNCR